MKATMISTLLLLVMLLLTSCAGMRIVHFEVPQPPQRHPSHNAPRRK